MGSDDTRTLLAAMLFEEGEFERALVQCDRVLDRNPRHAPARALRTEVLFILGIGVPSAPDVDYSAFFISNLGVGSRLRATDGSTDD